MSPVDRLHLARPVSIPPAPDGPTPSAWIARITDHATHLDLLERLLAPDERDRASRCRHPEVRNRFVTARALLRLVLGREMSTPPTELRLTSGARGKPVLEGAAGAALPHFNLSHSGDLIAVALSWDADVGVDVEALRPLANPVRLAARLLSPAEHRAWRELPEAPRHRTVLAAWTRKESVLKATGWGLRRSPRDVVIAPSGEHHGAWLPVHTAGDDARWWVHDLTVPAAYVGAIATARPRVVGLTS